jgi:hypothetical protein
VSADITRVNQWIWETLSHDNILNSTLMLGSRIYFDQAPQSTPLTSTVVLCSYLGGADKVQTSTSRFTNAIYLIRAVRGGSSYDAIEAIADRIDEILTVRDVGVLIRDTRIASCNREQPHQRKDAENGVPVVYLGGFYRIRFQPAGF